MSYSSYLSNIIKESGYSLRDIASLCEKKYNVEITASYLSKLQKGTQTPASREKNIAIAKVCETDPDDLLFEADFERAPESVKKLTNEMIEYLRKFLIASIEEVDIKDKNIKASIEIQKNNILKMSNRQFVQEINNYGNVFGSDDPLEFNFKENNSEEIIMKLSLGKKMVDNSMFPVIKEGDKLELVKLEEYKNGDIVSVILENGKNIVRTYIATEKDIVLIPTNNAFETLTLDKNKIKILGKVKYVTTEL